MAGDQYLAAPLGGFSGSGRGGCERSGHRQDK
jgi:hypothetical protein